MHCITGRPGWGFSIMLLSGVPHVALEQISTMAIPVDVLTQVFYIVFLAEGVL